VAEEKNGGGVAFAMADFLAGLRLNPSERVLGALALEVADALAETPAYAKGRLARELREIIGELARAEVRPENLSVLDGIEPVNDVVEEHLDRAFAALAQVGIRELEATAAALAKRDDGLARFGGVFSGVAFARERGKEWRGARYTLERAIRHLDDGLAERLEGATAPFWAHVLAARDDVEEEDQ
jgi:hypothetical protein